MLPRPSHFVFRRSLEGDQPCRFPHPTSAASCLSWSMVLEFLQCGAPSFWPPPSVLEVLFALASLPHKTQQFQKNAYHFDKHLISEPTSAGSSTASMTPVTFKINYRTTENHKGPSWYQQIVHCFVCMSKPSGTSGFLLFS